MTKLIRPLSVVNIKCVTLPVFIFEIVFFFLGLRGFYWNVMDLRIKFADFSATFFYFLWNWDNLLAKLPVADCRQFDFEFILQFENKKYWTKSWGKNTGCFFRSTRINISITKKVFIRFFIRLKHFKEEIWCY